MTVCIAAVCNLIEGRPQCVLAAADRMITIGAIEYQPQQTKMVFFATNTAALFSGDMQLHAAVVPRVQRRSSHASTRESRTLLTKSWETSMWSR